MDWHHPSTGQRLLGDTDRGGMVFRDDYTDIVVHEYDNQFAGHHSH